MNLQKTLSIGSDHGGFALKEELKKRLAQSGFACEDEGCFSADSVDYPDIAKLVCSDVARGRCGFGILICTSGIGMSMAANKACGIRAALCLSEDAAKFSRMHNDANVLCLGAKYLDADLAERIALLFAETGFDGGRHERRVKKIMSIQNG